MKIILKILIIALSIGLTSNHIIAKQINGQKESKSVFTSKSAKVVYGIVATVLGIGIPALFLQRIAWKNFIERGKQLKSIFETKNWNSTINKKYFAGHSDVRLGTWKKNENGVCLTYNDFSCSQRIIHEFYDDLMTLNAYKISINEKPWDVRMEKIDDHSCHTRVSFTMPKEFIEPRSFFDI